MDRKGSWDTGVTVDYADDPLVEQLPDGRVPVLSAPPLARALHRHAEVGDGVPAALYAAVAEVLAWVYQLRLARGYGSVLPGAPTLLDVPADLDPGPDTEAEAVPALQLAPVRGGA